MNHKEHKEHKEHKGLETRRTGNNHPAVASIPPTTEQVVHEVIGAAIAVHRALGPGFIEPVYDRAMRIELRHRNLRTELQKAIQIEYRGEVVCRHRLDLVVEGIMVVEIKAVRKLRPIHQAQILSYLKASGCRVGLLMNFNVPVLLDGLRRFVR
jgi:GxxExxY protein